MTTSTFSSLAMSPPLLGHDMRHVRNAEGLVAFHGSVDHVDGVAARDEVDERPGRSLPAVELPLAHQVDELALLHAFELREATPLARLARPVDRCDRRPVEVRKRGLDVEDAGFEQRLLGRNRKLLIDEMRDARRAGTRNHGLAQCLQGLGLVGLQQAKGHALGAGLARGQENFGAAHRERERAKRGTADKVPSFHLVHDVLPGEEGQQVLPRCYIGGTCPCRPTLTRAAVRVPSGWRCVTANTLAPGLSSLRSVGVKDTITALSGTSTFFSPPLYCTVSTRSLPMLVTLATLALVILLLGLRSQS